jgi:hypothetical protein
MSGTTRLLRRAETVLAGVAALLVAIGSPRDARACGATCATPEFWDVQFGADAALSVVSNFGVLHETQLGFELVCEQAIGSGLITEGALESSGYVVAMTDGLYEQAGDVCEYRRVDLAAGDDWPFAFQVAPTSTPGETERWALVLDRDADELSVVRSRAGGSFEPQATFPTALGLRRLSVAGASERVFVSGPREMLHAAEIEQPLQRLGADRPLLHAHLRMGTEKRMHGTLPG